METKQQKQQLLVKHLETQNGDFELDISPEFCGWTYCGLKILNLQPNEKKSFYFENYELCVLPMSGFDITVTIENKDYLLRGRENPFSTTTDFIYLPLNTKFDITSRTAAKIAFPMTKCSRKFDVEFVPAEKVRVELRGGGQATRQINNFCSPSTFNNAHKICSVEVYTPEGNWSSYPPHKHDTESENEAQLEEIYYFYFEDPKGFALHRTYTKDGEIDATETIRTGDVFLIPRGYHGPTVAAPGYHLYHINVMAGPSEKRSMAFCDDPDYKWIRDEWSQGKIPKDQRLPICKGGCPEA